MSREHVIDHRDQHDAGDSEAAHPHHGLPPEIHARVIRMGPGHAPALSEILIAHPGLSTRILAVAAPQMGVSAVKAAIATATPNAAGSAVATESAPATQIASTVPSTPTTEAAVAPASAEADAAAEPGASERGPSAAVISSARTYNRRHSHLVAMFDAATDRSCAGADGELDPVAVWRWQAEHGLGRDGRVGPRSAAAAQAAGKRTVVPQATAVVATAPAAVVAPAPAAVVAPAPAAVVAPAPAAAIAPAPAAAIASASAAVIAPAPAAVTAQPVADVTPQPATAPPAQAGGGQPEAAPAPAPAVPARPDDGGPGSLARGALAKGSAAEALKHLASDNDATLNANLADYGNLSEQRALLDAVIAEGGDAALVKTAFHAYWHVEVTGLDARNVAQSWPVPVLQSIHHQLKLLPDKDARAGAWTKLSLKNNGAGSNRGFWAQNKGEGDFSIVGNAGGWTKNDWHEGYSVQLTAPAPASAPALEVTEGGRFKVGDTLVLDRTGPAREIVTIASIAGNTYSLGAPLRHDHDKQATLEPDNGSAARKVNWLDYTVRHEIAHSLDGGAVEGKGFYALGGWQTNSPLALDQWVTAMGGESAKKGNGIAIPDDMPKGTPETADRSWFRVKLAAEAAIRSGAKSLFSVNNALLPYQGKGIPIIDALEAALRGGAGFYNNPTSIYASNGKRFSINFDQGLIQHHHESALSDRVTNYAISAPAEFFAEAYAVFYEEAGKPGVTDADYGGLIRNASWRGWMREHVHDRGHGPAGTGAAKPLDGKHASGEEGAHAEAARRGKKSGNSGL